MTLIKTYGNSMAPIFRDGDVLNIQKTPPSRLKVDDIITYQKKGLFITHRLIHKSKNYFKTAGDNNFLIDKDVKTKQILGKVVSIQRGKHIINPELIYLHQSSVYMKETIRMKKIWEEGGIDFVYLKGLPIHLYFQKKIPRRLYADCDILITPNSLKKLEKIFKKEGYSLVPEKGKILPNWLKVDKPERLFSKVINRVNVSFDVHTEVAFMIKQFGELNALYPKTLSEKLTDDFLSNKKVIKIDNQSFNILSKTNLIIYLALHIFSHNLRGYYQYELLANLIKKQDPNLEDITRKINLYKLINFIFPVFFLINKYYLKLPNNFLKSIQPKGKNLEYIKQNLLRVNIWEREIKTERGVSKFRSLFVLSPNPTLRKLTVLTKPHILYAVSWVLFIKLKVLIYRRFYNNLFLR